MLSSESSSAKALHRHPLKLLLLLLEFLLLVVAELVVVLLPLQERVLGLVMLALELLLLLLAVDCLSSSVGCKLCIASARMDMLELPLAFAKS